MGLSLLLRLADSHVPNFVSLRHAPTLAPHLLNVAMDRFGQDAYYRTGANGALVVSAQVEVSPTFLSWVLCFGGEARILEPPSAREALQKLAREALERYGERA